MMTVIPAIIMMAGLFLLLWSAVGFVQDKRFFSTAPKEVQEAVQPKQERFTGQHAVGWCMLIAALIMMLGAVLLGAWDGIRNGFVFRQFFTRFLVMLWSMKLFDILVFDWFLLCRSNFFPHYYPEVKGVLGTHLFGYNFKSHLKEMFAHIIISLLLAWGLTAFF